MHALPFWERFGRAVRKPNIKIRSRFTQLDTRELGHFGTLEDFEVVYDRTRVFAVLYGAVQYGIFGGRTRTRTAIRRTFSIYPNLSELNWNKG